MDDPFHWREALAGLAALLAIASMIYSWLTAKSKANASAIAEIRKKDHEQDVKLAELQTGVDSINRSQSEVRKDLSVVHRRVDETAASVHKVLGTVESLDRNTRLITEHLLNQGKGDKPK